MTPSMGEAEIVAAQDHAVELIEAEWFTQAVDVGIPRNDTDR